MEGLRELMSYRDMKLVAERDMWMISALLAGGSIVMPFLLPFSVVALGAAGLQARRQRRARNEQPIAAIAEMRLAVAPGAIVARGTVHPLRAPARRAWDGGTCVAAQLAVRSLGGLFLRATAVAPFVVAAPDGDLVVDGVVHFAPPLIVYRLISHPVVTGADPRLAALGVPASWRLAGMIHTAVIAPGDTVTVTGPVSHEPVPALATYRDGGIARVMRGTPSAPVLLEPAPS
jgi:hypothetical protein